MARPARGAAPRKILCAQCGEPTTWEGNPWRPFCSERCKMTDLGAWAEGKYSIPSEDAPGTDEEEG
ncbi:MAG: DNA gyrase inhibitor YacG [SAR324 cluster bacterium]|nr:DNA gyrase inhibitor YacG [SAR324 cluster bacterium]